MIKSVLIFNNHGKPRITKFYQQIDIGTQQALLQEIYSLVSKRPDTACNFLEGSQMLGGKDTRVIYRHYATLYFVFVVDESESELGILDLIQVLETNISEIVSAYNEANKLKKRSGTIATISTSGASAVARDMGAHFASTVTSTLQSTLQTTVTHSTTVKFITVS
ncbi:10435_t:CDS:2 [Racocetra fulgida]|uniref:10435_t:CDS:1 n=1 Tax=Racocetra fulgida TaxID=60492 RepID=A0A9N8Z3Z6_9GLOM|nr:10435_t:CDS:2 [Racocetra fulgida]